MPRLKGFKKIKRMLFSWPAIFVLLVVVVVVAVAAWDMYQTSRETQAELDRLEQRREVLAERRDTIASEASRLTTERGIEEEIREKFSVRKEGEHVVVLVDERDRASTSATSSSSWWQEVLGYIWPW